VALQGKSWSNEVTLAGGPSPSASVTADGIRADESRVLAVPQQFRAAGTIPDGCIPRRRGRGRRGTYFPVERQNAGDANQHRVDRHCLTSNTAGSCSVILICPTRRMRAATIKSRRFQSMVAAVRPHSNRLRLARRTRSGTSGRVLGSLSYSLANAGNDDRTWRLGAISIRIRRQKHVCRSLSPKTPGVCDESTTCALHNRVHIAGALLINRPNAGWRCQQRAAGHSWRSARIGSTLVARSAGIRLASTATTIRNSAAPAMLTGSAGLTW
jgi:hypothetical protein